MSGFQYARSPYPGLRPFLQNESDIFFGRGQQVEHMIAKLESHCFLAVVGASGSGKSSLVRAGLLPALDEGFLTESGGGWCMVTMRPGEAPFTALARALHEAIDSGADADETNAAAFTRATLRSGPSGLVEALNDMRLPTKTNVLLLVDQFEEIFRFRRGGVLRKPSENGDSDKRSPYEVRNEASAFVNLLLATVDQIKLPVYVVLTMRSEFLGDCSAFESLPEAINDGQFLTPRMSRDQLRRAIEGPASVFGATVSPDITTQILNQMGTDPDQLSLMQHSLMRTWSNAVSRIADPKKGIERPETIEFSDYEATGGFGRALLVHADEVFEELDENGQRIAEVMFRCLTEVGPDGRIIRRPVRLGEVAAVADVDAAEVQSVAEHFRATGRNFLTPSPDQPLKLDTVLDISHETLIRQWQRLKDWVTDEANSAEVYRRLLETAKLWKDKKAVPWRSTELQLAVEWKQKKDPNKAWANRYGGHLELSREFLNISIHAEHRERRMKRLRRLLGFGAIVLILIAAIVAAVFRINELTERGLRERADDLAYDAQLARIQNLWRVNPDRAREFLLDDRYGIEQREFTWRLFYRLATTGPQKFEGLQGAVNCLAFSSPEEKLIVTGGADGSVRLWNYESYKESDVSPLLQSKVPVMCIAFSRDERVIAWGRFDGRIQICDLNDGRLLSLEGHPNYPVRSVAFAPGGKMLASASDDKTIKLWGLETNALHKSLEEHTHWVSCVAFSSDGNTLASASYDTTVRLWNVSAGMIRATLRGHSDAVLSVTFSPDDTQLASSGDDRTIRLWDVLSGRELRPPGPLKGHVDSVHSVAFSPDGKRLASAGDGPTIKLWDADANWQPITLSRQATAVYRCVAFSPDGKSLASAGSGAVEIWDAEVGLPMTTREHYVNGVTQVTFPPNGDLESVSTASRLVLATKDGTIRLWDSETGMLEEEIRAHDGAEITALAYDRTGRTFATASLKQVTSQDQGDSCCVKFWDVLDQEFKFRKELTVQDVSKINSLAFAPSGQRLAGADDGGKVVLWDTSTGSVIRVLDGHTIGAMSVAFDSTGEILISGGKDQSVKLWDPRTGRELDAQVAHDDWVMSVAVSPDGETVATAGAEGTIWLWKISGPQLEQLVQLPTDEEAAITTVVFSWDGKTLASGGMDSNIRLWDPKWGNLRGTLSGHTAPVRSLAFRRDNNVLASAGDDDRVFIWAGSEPEKNGD